MPSSVKMMVNVAKKIILHLNEIVLNPEQKEDFNLASGKYKILVFYNKKIDAVSFVQNMLQIMPVDMNYLRNLKNRKWKTKKIPMYNMDGALLLSSFIRQLLFVNIYRAISDSLAAEHFTRMITMQNAENNIDEHLEEMNLEYQQRRQTEITNELLDVVSGAEVLKSKK
jgi:F-type H+-transporting ATPase subunit gamma